MRKLLVLLLLVVTVTTWTMAETKTKPSIKETPKKELKADTTAVDTTKNKSLVSAPVEAPKPPITFMGVMTDYVDGLKNWKASTWSLTGLILLLGAIIFALTPTREEREEKKRKKEELMKKEKAKEA